MYRMKYTKKAIAISVAMLLLWIFLGTGATLAWFTDIAAPVKNTFEIGELDLSVSYKRLPSDRYQPVQGDTPIFDESALYEPGYTQTVYLKIENVGEIDFDYKISVDMVDFKDSINVYGMPLHLAEYLRYGIVISDREDVVMRPMAQQIADQRFDSAKLNQFSQTVTLPMKPGDVQYVMLVIYMPTEVGNAANHRKGARVPEIEFGITVLAQQAGAPLE